MSLCRAMAERGRACGLLRLDAHPLFLPSGRGQGSNLELVTEALADANVSRANPLDAALSPFLRHLSGGSEVILVSPQANADIARAALLLRSRGARVTVALVNVRAFVGAERNGRRGENIVSESYQTQAQSLRESGFDVVVAPPESPGQWNGAVELSLLRAAVREVMEPQPVTRHSVR
jgi:hypothetical protein